MTDPDGNKSRKRKVAEPDPWIEPVAAKRRDTKNVLAEKAAKEQDDLRKEQAKLKKRWDDELAARPKAPPGQRGDGSFHARFIQVGQGDCIVMSTPAGQLILVDCGSKSSDLGSGSEEDDPDKDAYDEYAKRIVSSLLDKKFLGTSKKIDIAIFTHPDADHFNKLGEFLKLSAIKVGRVYHSNTFSEYGAGCSWLRGRVSDEKLIRQVVYTKEAAPEVKGKTPDPESGPGVRTLGGLTIAAAGSATDVDCLDDLGGLRVVAETNCKITILASGISKDYVRDSSDAAGKNRGSVVTLVETFGKKLLLCGDATTSTEEYLLNRSRDGVNNQARLAGVDIVQIGHHGSNTTSSGPGFIKTVNPKERALISAGRTGIRSHHLPTWPVVQRYVKRFSDSGRGTVAHLGWCWDLDVSNYNPQQKDIAAPVWITGSHGDQDIDWPTK